MAAITGAAGLPATLAAIRRGGAVALANKEALVCAGEVMLEAVRAAGATLLPVDSEHNAVFQSLAGATPDSVERIVLTASGGPVPHREPRRDGEGDARDGAPPSGVVDGAEDQHRQRDDDEQGPRSDRGGAAVRPRRDADRRADPSAIGDPRHGLLPRRQRAGAARRARHAHPDRPRPGLAGAAADRRRPASTSPHSAGSTSSSPTRTVSRRCASRGSRCAPAAVRRRS